MHSNPINPSFTTSLQFESPNGNKIASPDNTTKAAQQAFALQSRFNNLFQRNNNDDDDSFIAPLPSFYKRKCPNLLKKLQAVTQSIKYDNDHEIVPCEGMRLRINNKFDFADVYQNGETPSIDEENQLFFSGLPPGFDVRYLICLLNNLKIPLESIRYAIVKKNCNSALKSDFAFVYFNNQADMETTLEKNNLVLFKPDGSGLYNSSKNPTTLSLMHQAQTTAGYSLLSIKKNLVGVNNLASTPLSELGSFHAYQNPQLPVSASFNPEGTIYTTTKQGTGPRLFLGQLPSYLKVTDILCIFQAANIDLESIAKMRIPLQNICFVDFIDGQEAEKALKLQKSVLLTSIPTGFWILKEPAHNESELLRSNFQTKPLLLTVERSSRVK